MDLKIHNNKYNLWINNLIQIKISNNINNNLDLRDQWEIIMGNILIYLILDLENIDKYYKISI